VKIGILGCVFFVICIISRVFLVKRVCKCNINPFLLKKGTFLLLP
jgi:hypothetical protein